MRTSGAIQRPTIMPIELRSRRRFAIRLFAVSRLAAHMGMRSSAGCQLKGTVSHDRVEWRTLYAVPRTSKPLASVVDITPSTSFSLSPDQAPLPALISGFGLKYHHLHQCLRFPPVCVNSLNGGQQSALSFSRARLSSAETSVLASPISR